MSCDDSDAHSYSDPVWIGVSAILLGHFAASFWPGVTLWGIDYWSEFPLAYRIAMLVAGLTIAFPAVARQLAGWTGQFRRPHLISWSVITALAVLMIVFHSRALVYGDAYSILAVIRNPEVPALIGNLKFQPLDLYLHWGVFHYIVTPLGGTVELTYAIIGALCGMAGVAALVRIARAMTTDRAQRLFLIMCGMTSGSVFLWFGHMESYTMAMTAALWVIALLVRSDEHPHRVALAWLFWVAAIMSHVLTVVMLPALLWGSIVRVREFARRSWTGRPAVLLVFGFALGLAAARLGEMRGLNTFVPLLPVPVDLYSAWSWAHLADTVNLLLFAAPLGVIAAAAMLFRRTRQRFSEPVELLAIVSAALWVFAFWVDPMLGAFRDWDLLCGFGIVMSVMCGGVLLERVSRARNYWWVMMLALSLAHVGSWVAANVDLQRSARRVDRIVNEDMHYSSGYDLGGRRPAWALILSKGLEWQERATGHFLYRLTYNPQDAVSWANLGIVYQHRNLLDSAMICYGIAMKTNQNNALYAMAYGQVGHATGHLRLARVALERAVSLAPGLYEARMALGKLYRDLELLDAAEQQARLALEIDSTRADAHTLMEEIRKLRGGESAP